MGRLCSGYLCAGVFNRFSAGALFKVPGYILYGM